MHFCNDLWAKSFMDCINLIIGGDLNFSIGKTETWGPNSILDPL